MKMRTTESPEIPFLEGFQIVANVSQIIHILEDRLPKACNVYNMALGHSKFATEMTFYTYYAQNNDADSLKTCWILATYVREDYGVDINISAPPDLLGVQDFRKALISSTIIDWNKPYIFAAIEKELLDDILQIIAEATGKEPIYCMNNMYYITPNEGQYFESSLIRNDVEIKPMEVVEGATFLRDHWKFATVGTLPYVLKLIQRNGSAGVFVDGKLVGGVTMNGSGMMTMLHTMNEYRHNGFAQMVMKYFIKILSAKNIMPCCTVEASNAPSIALQKKIGLKFSHETYYFTVPQ